MLVPGKSFSGPYLIPHGQALAEIIARRQVRIVLDIGCSGIRNAAAIATGPAWWGLGATAGIADPGLSLLPAGARYDMVIATHWLSTLPLTALQAAIDVLHHLTAGAIYVVEPIVAASSTLPLTCKGLDRVTWAYALGRKTETEITLACRLRQPGNTMAMTRLRSDGQGIWHRPDATTSTLS